MSAYSIKNNWAFLVVLAIGVFIWAFNLNYSLFMFFNNYHNILPIQVWEAINYISFTRRFILPSILILLTLCFKRHQLLNVIAMIGAFYALFFGLKSVIGELRPYAVLSPNSFFFNLEVGENVITSAHKSFPSGHTGNMAIFVFSLITLFFNRIKPVKILLIALLILTGLARVCTGWHWPLDVLFSGLIGYALVKIFLNFTQLNKKF